MVGPVAAAAVAAAAAAAAADAADAAAAAASEIDLPSALRLPLIKTHGGARKPLMSLSIAPQRTSTTHHPPPLFALLSL